MQKVNRIAGALSLVFLISGCAAIMAARQPSYTDVTFLRPGVSRGEVIAKLGAPVTSETDQEGNLVEYYRFKQGYKTPTKVIRVMFHVGADVVTLFLWEFVGMPIEVVFAGKQTTVQATFDEQKDLRHWTVSEK